MSSFEKLCCAFGDVKSAALTTEFAMQTRQPQSSFALETARRRNLTYAQTMLISKLFILLEPERVGKFRVLGKLEIEPNNFLRQPLFRFYPAHTIFNARYDFSHD